MLYWVMDFFKLFYIETGLVLCIAAAWLIDLVIGNPVFLLLPAQLIRVLSRFTEERLHLICNKYSTASPQNKDHYERRAGTILTLYTVLFALVFTAVLLDCFRLVHPALYYLLNTYFLYAALSTRKLVDEAYRIRSLLRKGNLPQARRQLQTLSLGEDTQNRIGETGSAPPNESAIIRTAIDSIAERAIDSVISPLCFILLGAFLGIPAPLVTAFTAICVQESTIGQKKDSPQQNSQSPSFRYFCTKLYNAANYIPARICGVLLPAASFFCSFDFQKSYNMVRRDHQNYMDSNSAQSASALAGALNIQLGGENYEQGKLSNKSTVGDDIKTPEPNDISAAAKIVTAASAIFMLAMSILLLQFHK